MIDAWQPYTKPTSGTSITSVTTTSMLHAKGKFMGILGLTYPGVIQSVTTNVTTTTAWEPIEKPTAAAWSSVVKPSASGWNSVAKPTN